MIIEQQFDLGMDLQNKKQRNNDFNKKTIVHQENKIFFVRLLFRCFLVCRSVPCSQLLFFLVFTLFCL